MSKDKYPSIFFAQMEAIVFIILQIFFAARAVLKIGEYLTIRPVTIEGEGSNCFSITQLVGQKRQ